MMMSEYKQAKALARLMHRGQVDKAGEDYFDGHLTRVAESMETYGEASVAYLHDIIEDTPVTGQDLSDMGFSDDLIRSVGVLTRRDGENYIDYIDRIAKSGDRVAIAVKDADLHDHLRPGSMAFIPASLRLRYERAIEHLSEVL